MIICLVFKTPNQICLSMYMLHLLLLLEFGREQEYFLFLPLVALQSIFYVCCFALTQL